MPSILTAFFALVGVPLFAVFGALALIQYHGDALNPIAMISEYYKLASQPVLETIPLFTLAGYLLAESGAPKRLVAVSEKLLGWMPGGLALVTIASCAFFTAFTGASGVTIIALGGLLYPLLRRNGCGDQFSLGLVTCCGSVGLLFAPSLPLILYGMIAGVSIDQLFLAGIKPGMLIILILALYSIREEFGRKNPKASEFKKIIVSFGYFVLFSVALAVVGAVFISIYSLLAWLIPSLTSLGFLVGLTLLFIVATILLAKIFPNHQTIAVFRAAVWELPLPVLIIASIYGGFVTVSEAAAVTAAYVLLIETLVHRDINIAKDLPRIIKESMLLVGGILIILGVAMGLTNYMINQQVPDRIFIALAPHLTSKWTFLIALNAFLLVVGCLMDVFSAIIVVLPIISPIAAKFGVSPLHLAIVFLTNMEIGYLTPPVGLNLFISSFRFERPVLEITRKCLPYMFLLLSALALITFVPWISDGSFSDLLKIFPGH